MLRPTPKTLVVWLLVPYALYVALFACHGPSNDVERYACAQLHQVVYPAWHLHVAPRLAAADAALGVSAKTAPLVAALGDRWAAFDAQYLVSLQAKQHAARASTWARLHATQVSTRVVLAYDYVYARVKLYWTNSMAPMAEYYLIKYQTTVENSVDGLGAQVKLTSRLAAQAAYFHTKLFWRTRAWPVLVHAGAAISSNEYAQTVSRALRLEQFAAEVRRVLDLLLEKSASINGALQKKSDFVRAEFHNLVKFDGLKNKFRGDSHIVDVVNDILEDVTSDDKKVGAATSKAKKVAEDVTSNAKDATSNAKEAVEDATSNAKKVVEDATHVGSAEESEEWTDADDEPLTLTSTLTATVTLESQDQLATAAPHDVALDSSPQSQIDAELEYWRTKVDKTLQLAAENLEGETKPVLEKIIAALKDTVSEEFQTLQLDNYKRYKVMNELIASIDKDSEKIRETRQIIEKPEVERQIMRDKIKEAYNATESTMKKVEGILNEAHTEVMTKYFEIAQGTVDVLESFADTTILDFSNRLTNLIAFLAGEDDFEDKLSWSAWKSFHKVKDLIFTFRDKLFDEANTFRVKPRGSVRPKALQDWTLYLDNANFHIKFLLQDNDEYLKLVRAKANVAYQMREGLTRELIKAAEEAEKAAKEAPEAAQAVIEQAAESAQVLEEKLETAGDNLKEKAARAVDDVKEGVASGAPEIKEQAASVAEDAKDAVPEAKEIKDAVVGVAQDVKESAISGATDVKEGAASVADAAQDKAETVVEAAQDKVETVTEELAEQVLSVAEEVVPEVSATGELTLEDDEEVPDAVPESSPAPIEEVEEELSEAVPEDVPGAIAEDSV